MESISNQLHFSCDESTEQLLLPLKAPEEDEVEEQEAAANQGAATETCTGAVTVLSKMYSFSH